MGSRTGFAERWEEEGKGSESSLGASGVRDKGWGELGCWREEWGKQRNGKQREVPRRNPRFISHQVGPRESSGLNNRTWRQDWLEKESGGHVWLG